MFEQPSHLTVVTVLLLFPNIMQREKEGEKQQFQVLHTGFVSHNEIYRLVGAL
uniref:Uncharacterized protein n=1 Tax=Arundo donax TaxID=35708 RepID=A0A0A8ZHE2_ARUDO